MQINSFIKVWAFRLGAWLILMLTSLAADAQGLFLNAQNEQWVAFVKKFKSMNGSSAQKINILQIGDSHIQGGYFTNQVRNLMNADQTMSAGLTFPYNLAKTNGSEEIRYYSPNQWVVSKWGTQDPGKLAITGYLISSRDSVIEMSIRFNNPANRADCIRFYHNLASINAECKNAQLISTRKLFDSICISEFKFSSPVDSVHISFRLPKGLKDGLQLYSVEMDNSYSRASYQALGINGITYNGYAENVNYLPWMRQISPDCLIVSFGTNDIYSGKINTGLFASTVGRFIDTLKHAFPDMVIIITSPGDHLRSKKYNNHAIAIASGVLRNVSIQKNCLFWDFFAEMGGEGSSRDWYKKGWMFRDYVHLSKEGYKQQGNMFYDAFMNTVEQTWRKEEMLKAGIN